MRSDITKIVEAKTKASDAGNRTLVIRVTGGYTNHYTTSESRSPFYFNRGETIVVISSHTVERRLITINDACGNRTHALSDWYLKPAP